MANLRSRWVHVRNTVKQVVNKVLPKKIVKK